MDRRVIFCEDYSSVSVVFTEENLHGMMNREVYLCIDYYGKTFVALARSKFFDKYKTKIVWCEEFVPDVYDDLMKDRYEYRGRQVFGFSAKVYRGREEAIGYARSLAK